MLENALLFELHYSPGGKRHYTWLGLTVNSLFTQTWRKTWFWRPTCLAVLILPVFSSNELCLWCVDKLTAHKESLSADTSAEFTSHEKCIPKNCPLVMSQRALLAWWVGHSAPALLFLSQTSIIQRVSAVDNKHKANYCMLLPDDAPSAVIFFFYLPNSHFIAQISVFGTFFQLCLPLQQQLIIKTTAVWSNVAFSHLPCLVWAFVITTQRTLVRIKQLVRGPAGEVVSVPTTLWFEPVLKSSTFLHITGFRSRRHYGNHCFG